MTSLPDSYQQSAAFSASPQASCPKPNNTGTCLLCRCESGRQQSGKITQQSRCHISSRNMSTEALLVLMRATGIKNRLFWQLDMNFGYACARRMRDETCTR
ncbi:MAG: hypothetical protein Q4A06_09425 [Cardiobacteriaceae bacterium]|nr:hypothetical protein [Cardiobacteriaceae bacterium]